MNHKVSCIIVSLVIITAVFLSLRTEIFIHDNKSSNSLPDLGPDNLIQVKEPISNQLVKSPLVVTGKARGYWYFEASFPVRIFDDNGIELGLAVAQAGGDPADGGTGWMTEDFVPFAAILEFKKPSTERGVLILQKDNPSGLPEHDAELRIPIGFDLANWSNDPVVSRKCLATGCSGQICSDEDVITTCEYKAEYACYKTAKCKRQEDGKCGWTPTEDLVSCLGAAFQAESEAR